MSVMAKKWFVLSVPFFVCAAVSDAPIWNLADILIADNGSEISADTDSRPNIQLCSNFYLSVHYFTNFMVNFPIKNVKFWLPIYIG